MKKILITGGFGYIGGRIAKFLADRDRYFLFLGTRRSNLSRPVWLKNGNIVTMELLSDDSLDDICKGIDSIIHLASFNEIDSTKDPAKALLINGMGTLKLIMAAERAGVKQFIYMSTAHVYMSPLTGTITEKTIPRPIHPYAISHKVAEDFVLSARDRKTISGLVLRLSNGFGASISHDVNRWTLVVNDLCRQAVITRRLVLKTAGIQERDFITLTDVCRAIVHILNLSEDEDPDGIFNLGGEYSSSILAMAERIAKRCETILGYKPPIILPETKEDIRAEKLDYRIDKLKRTGFSLIKNIDEEIDATLILCKDSFSG